MREDTIEVDALVDSANAHWRRIGVPRRVRRRWRAELREQLAAAVREGRRARDVVGADAWAFAARWAEERQHHSLGDFAVSAAGVVAVVVGLLALLASGSRGAEAPSLTAGVAVAMLSLGLSGLLRAWHRLTGRQTGLLAIGVFIVSVVASIGLVPRVEETSGGLLLPLPLAWALVITGLAVAGANYARKATRLR